MLVTEGAGVPLSLMIESAQRAEVHLAIAVLDRLKVPNGHGGRPRKRPRTLVADKGYDSRALRTQLWRRGIRPCIPYQRGRRPRPGPKPDLSGYRERWTIERTFAWGGNYRRWLIRWERHAHNYLAFLLITCILIASRTLLG